MYTSDHMSSISRSLHCLPKSLLVSQLETEILLKNVYRRSLNNVYLHCEQFLIRQVISAFSVCLLLALIIFYLDEIFLLCDIVYHSPSTDLIWRANKKKKKKKRNKQTEENKLYRGWQHFFLLMKYQGVGKERTGSQAENMEGRSRWNVREQQALFMIFLFLSLNCFFFLQSKTVKEKVIKYSQYNSNTHSNRPSTEILTSIIQFVCFSFMSF